MERIIDNRCEEVHSLNDGQVVRDFVHRRIVDGFGSYQHIGVVPERRHCSQQFLECLGTKLAGTAQAARESGEFHFLAGLDTTGSLATLGPESFNHSRNSLDSPVDLRFGEQGPGREAYGAHREVDGDPHCLQSVRHDHFVSVARRSGGSGYLGKFRENGICLDAAETDAQGIGQSLFRVAVQSDVADPGGDSVMESVAQRSHMGCTSVKVFAYQLTRLSKPHDFQHVLRARTPTAFMGGTENELLRLDTGPDVQRPDSFGSVEFVAGYG